jgi:glycyl-tRNA synthetase alpha chain
VLLPPCDFEVPFATLQPDAFFRILGPDPWRAAYLQPVRRPLDGRYGRHPYRLGKHLQMQVVLKPPPADVQGLYLESLEALGLELALHDLRFAEWCWQPRSLGARGAGWHAQLDGLGVTRLTFLDRIAGRDLDPVCVEISYGLERLVMTLQGADSAFDLGWSESGADYGRLRRQDEEELSRYAFEIADAGGLRRRLDALDEEAGRCLEAGLSRPAYELAVRTLKLIDLLDARGDLSVRQRAGQLERVRERVVAIAELDLASRTAVTSGAGEILRDGAPEPEPVPEPAVKKKRSAKRRKTRKRRRPKHVGGAGEKDGR